MMNSFFKITQIKVDGEGPPISFKVREYLEGFIYDNVLVPKKIIIGGKWKIDVGLFFMSKGKFGPNNIFLAKGGPRTLSEENVKLYEIIIPMELINKAENPQLKSIEVIYESLKLFFTTNYKKVTPAVMDDLWYHLDLEYLLSLPYPAPIEEQRFVGDK